MPEFDPPDNYDPLELRGNHIVQFAVKLPDAQASNEAIKDILAQMAANEEANQDQYYAHAAERTKAAEADMHKQQEQKRQ